MKRCKLCGAIQKDEFIVCGYPTANGCCGGELEAVENKPTREQALEWWGNLQLTTQRILYKSYYGCEATDKFPDEIEEIWKKETQQIGINRSTEDKLKSVQELSKQPEVNFEMLKILVKLVTELDEGYNRDERNNMKLFFHLLSTKPTFAKVAHEKLKRLKID